MLTMPAFAAKNPCRCARYGARYRRDTARSGTRAAVAWRTRYTRCPDAVDAARRQVLSDASPLMRFTRYALFAADADATARQATGAAQRDVIALRAAAASAADAFADARYYDEYP